MYVRGIRRLRVEQYWAMDGRKSRLGSEGESSASSTKQLHFTSSVSSIAVYVTTKRRSTCRDCCRFASDDTRNTNAGAAPWERAISVYGSSSRAVEDIGTVNGRSAPCQRTPSVRIQPFPKLISSLDRRRFVPLGCVVTEYIARLDRPDIGIVSRVTR